jgi:hypothetical protein
MSIHEVQNPKDNLVDVVDMKKLLTATTQAGITLSTGRIKPLVK